MNTARAHVIPFDHLEQIRTARGIIEHEADALQQLASCVDTEFCSAVRILVDCPGAVIATGVGKAGLVAQKVVATLSSTGTRAHFLHPTEAVHGDLGCIHQHDVVLAFSNSGETEEICRLLPILAGMDTPIIAITAASGCTLGRAADVVLPLGRLREAGPLELAPTASTAAMMALGDALALTVSQARGFTSRDFATFHPAGQLGKQLCPVSEVMRSGDHLRVSPATASVRTVLQQNSNDARRTGAVILVDSEERLAGLFTDSDLARLLTDRQDAQLDRPVHEVMTRNPLTISVHSRLAEAIEILSTRRISELPVVDEHGHPVGLIDITDVIGLMPCEVPAA